MTIYDILQQLVLGTDTPEHHNELGKLVTCKYPQAFKGYLAVFKLIDRYAVIIYRLTDTGVYDGVAIEATYHAALRPLVPFDAEDHTP